MSYPLEAFTYVSASSVAPGTIVADDRGNWYLVAQKTDATSNRLVRLSRNENGGGPGDLLSSIEERVFAVAAPYKTSVRVTDLFDLRRSKDGPFLGTIIIAERLAIFTFDSERCLIGLDGRQVDESTVHSRRARFMKWSVWLLDAHDRKVSDTPLVEIDATAQ